MNTAKRVFLSEAAKKTLLIGISICVFFFATYIIRFIGACETSFEYKAAHCELAMAAEYFMLSIFETILGAFLLECICRKG